MNSCLSKNFTNSNNTNSSSNDGIAVIVRLTADDIGLLIVFILLLILIDRIIHPRLTNPW